MVGGRAWEVVLTWGRVPNWGGGVGRQPRAHAQAHAHAFDAFVPPLFFFLQRFFGDFATQSQSRVLVLGRREVRECRYGAAEVA